MHPPARRPGPAGTPVCANMRQTFIPRAQCSAGRCVFEQRDSNLPCPRVHLEMPPAAFSLRAEADQPPTAVWRPMPSTALDCTALESIALLDAAEPIQPDEVAGAKVRGRSQLRLRDAGGRVRWRLLH